MAGHMGDFMRWRERALRHCDRLAERILFIGAYMENASCQRRQPVPYCRADRSRLS